MNTSVPPAFVVQKFVCAYKATLARVLPAYRMSGQGTAAMQIDPITAAMDVCMIDVLQAVHMK